jgi:hypothetical protein
MKVYLPVIGLALLIGMAGCGVYSFSASGNAGFTTLNVNQFENNTIEYQLSDQLTDAVVDAFIRDNTVKIVDPSSAEAQMKGTVTNYRRDSYTFNKQDEVTEYAVKVTVAVEVVRAESGEKIWEDQFYAEGIYNAVSEVEEDGQSRAITLLASDILDRTTKRW